MKTQAALILVLLCLVPACISPRAPTQGHASNPTAASSAARTQWLYSPDSAGVSNLAQRVAQTGMLPPGGRPMLEAFRLYAAGNNDFIEQSFGSEEAFLNAVELELRQMYGRGRFFGPQGNGAMMFGIQSVNHLAPLSDEEACLISVITTSENPVIHIGDTIIYCETELFMPGMDLVVIAGTLCGSTGKCLLGVMREEQLIEVTAEMSFVPMTAEQVLARRCTDAIEAAILNKELELIGVRAWWREEGSPVPYEPEGPVLQARWRGRREA